VSLLSKAFSRKFSRFWLFLAVFGQKVALFLREIGFLPKMQIYLDPFLDSAEKIIFF